MWCAGLDLPSDAVFDLERSLSNHEKERAARFRFARDRKRFVAGRGLLRWLIGAYLDCDPCAIRFAYGPFGKPYLERGTGLESISFNLSHSEARAVFAFGRGRKLGVDLEQLDRKVDVRRLSSEFFTSQEAADIMAQPSHEQQHIRFFEFWTRKEAILKALGRGLSMSLREVDVSNIGGAPGYAIRLANPKRCWSMHQFVPAPGYIAALAASGNAIRVLRGEVGWTESPSGGFISARASDSSDSMKRARPGRRFFQLRARCSLDCIPARTENPDAQPPFDSE